MVILSSNETAAHCFKNKHAALDGDAGGVIMREAFGVKNRTHIPKIIESVLMPTATLSLLPNSLTSTSVLYNQSLFTHLNKLSSSSPDVVVTLSTLSSASVYIATSLSVLGPLFPVDSYDDFVTLDAGLPYLMANIPFLGSKAKAARGRLLSHINVYINDGWRNDGDGYIEGASEFISGAVRVFKQASLSESDSAGLLLGLLVGIHANVIRMVFWLVAYLLNDQDAFSRVQEEVRTTVAAQFSDITSLLASDLIELNQTNFPLVDSAIKETLRLTALPSSLREAKFDTQIVGENGRVYHIEKGDRVLVDSRGVHLDESVYPDPETFKIDRFVSSADSTSRPRNVLTFGGGAHIVRIFFFNPP
jgi:hypothetical protein